MESAARRARRRASRPPRRGGARAGEQPGGDRGGGGARRRRGRARRAARADARRSRTARRSPAGCAAARRGARARDEPRPRRPGRRQATAASKTGVVDALRRHGLARRAASSAPSRYRSSPASPRREPALPRSFTYPEDRLGVDRQPRCFALRCGPCLAVLCALLPAPPAGLAARVRRACRDSELDRRDAALPSRSATGLGVAVYVWTVNEPALARTLVESGVDGIITRRSTDHPRGYHP